MSKFKYIPIDNTLRGGSDWSRLLELVGNREVVNGIKGQSAQSTVDGLVNLVESGGINNLKTQGAASAKPEKEE